MDTEGLVYEVFDEDEHVIAHDLLPDMDQVLSLGLDYGSTGNMRGILLGIGPHPLGRGQCPLRDERMGPRR